ncbi:MAG: hypothetical protein WC795_02165 [Candidatus Paceibacterota bacterium]|jgi:hypothetical protein
MKHKNTLLIALLMLVIFSFVPAQTNAALRLIQPFGGLITLKPAATVVAEETRCLNLLTCGGNEGVVWTDTTDISCSKGTFTLKPSWPIATAATNYCANAGSDQRPRIGGKPITVAQKILGRYLPTIPTKVGVCTCTNGVGPASEVTVVPVIIDMAQVLIFGNTY